MTATGGDTQRRASRFEVLGAWLRLWTPPRDVEIPPVPWRKLAIGGALAAAVCGGALALIIPAIDQGKERGAALERRQQAAARAAEVRRLLHDQRPRTARAASLLPARGASPAAQRAARTALLGRVERDITRDATARVHRGELHGSIGATSCRPAAHAAPLTDLSSLRGVFDCFTPTRAIKANQTTAGGSLGYPFRAVLDYRTFRYAWCKTNPVPGELEIPDPKSVVQLPRACRR